MKPTLSELFNKKRNKEFKPIQPSKRAEVKYRNALLLLIASLKTALLKRLRAFLLGNPTDAEIIEHTTQILDGLRKADTLDYAKKLSRGVVGAVNETNKERLIQNVQKGTDVDLTPLVGDTAVKAKLDEYIAKNVSLITSVKNDYLNDVEKAIRESYLKNGRAENLATIIHERTGVSKSRARLIARDQTAKINAELDQERMQGLGVKLYIWCTAKDERVRHTHANMQGVLCRFDDDSVYSKDGGKTWIKREADKPKCKPGVDIQCRCFAKAIIGV